MALDIDIYISYAHIDDQPMSAGERGWVAQFHRALELRLSQLLGRAVVVYRDSKLQGNDVIEETDPDRLQRTAVVVAIVSPAYARSEWARRELAAFDEIAAAPDSSLTTGRGRLFKVVKAAVPLAQQPPELQHVLGHEFFSVDPETGRIREFHEIFGPDAERDFWMRLDDLAHDVAAHVRLMTEGDAAAPLTPGDAAPMSRFADPHDARDRVWLGVSAPHVARAGSTFTARFVAYIEARAELAEKQLRALDGHVDGAANAVLGLTPDRAGGWLVGTPVTVRVSGAHLRVSPSQRSFEWDGRENLLSFIVTVDSNAPAGNIALCFEAFIEGVSVAFIPLTVSIGESTRAPEREMLSERVASTAFASYASGDAARVAACLSALSRWDRGLDVFMDCLDLTPNEEWQRELQRVIPTRDTFLLFWSVNASHSRWVAWELAQAKASKGLGWIRPMPIDDPSVAPPPDDLKHLHFGDRYLIARQAFLKRTETAAGQ